MACIKAEVNLPPCGLTSGTTKTVIQLKAPTNQRLKIIGYGFYFDGGTSTATPNELKIMRQSSAGTALVSATPVPMEPELTETLQATCQTGSLTTQTEPTAGAILRTISIPAYQGQYEVYLPYGEEIIVNGGGFIGFAVTSQSAVNVRGFVHYEE